MSTGTFTGPLHAAFAPVRAQAALRELLRPADSALPVPPATERSVWAEEGSADRPTRQALREQAAAERSNPWPTPLASTAARVHLDGDRDQHEQLVFARSRRLTRAVVAAATTPEPGWIDAVADGLWQLCEQSTWCWPAHDDSARRRGRVLTDVTDPVLDLGAAEVAAQLAWTDHLLGAALDDRYPGLRERLRLETRRRVLDPFVARRDWHWLGLDGDVHNWNPWIHSQVLVSALRMLDGPDQAALRADVVDLVIEGLDRFVAALPADGAIDEGYSYWWNGAGRALEAVELLAHATGGRLDALGRHDDGAPLVPALHATVAFPHRMHLGGEWYVNVADGVARPWREQAWAVLHRAARRAGDEDALAHAASHRTDGAAVADDGDGLGRLLQALVDPTWSAARGRSPLPGTVRLDSVQIVLARESPGSARGLTLAVKGGHDAEAHNHCDVGSFVVASDGVPVVVDPGRPTYTAQTFGPDRYTIWTMRSAWHNLPTVAGVEQGVGAEFRARDVEVSDGGTTVAMDLAAAYPVDDLTAWRRTARIDRDAGTVVVHDAWELETATTAEAATTVHLVLAGEVRLEPGAAVVVPLEGATALRLTWDPAVPATTVRRDLGDPMLSRVWGDHLTRLDLDVGGRRRLTVTAAPTPAPA
ncbi:heparinase II/III family protein [Isoptericola chiayiensis]|uniref:Heparinase II/III family protein n=1 Tax=Isoptericola chiayiensis TaxID=579446 RepID=A0ABP8YLC5_9MICO|nr:heparinase II/III family protein [Isoptericola chiayiensis]NOW02390.1 hypothetical protein [Isoptericola chiayiensis]